MIAATIFDTLADTCESVVRFFKSIAEFDRALVSGDARRLDVAVAAVLRRN